MRILGCKSGCQGISTYTVAISARILVQLHYIVCFGLVEMIISTNPKHTIYRNLYENTDPVRHVNLVVLPRASRDHTSACLASADDEIWP